MYEKQNKLYTLNVFPERNIRNVFRFLFTRLEKVRGNPNLSLFRHVGFITEASQISIKAFSIK